MKNYHSEEIESKWLKQWERAGPPRAEDPPADGAKKPKFFGMVEFPYPSGEGLHIGHAFTNTIMDILARKKRMSGFNVLHPMGWDAFGLPTENYAIKTGIHPAVATKRNTDCFRAQMKRLAFSYNWDREVNTTDPNYYRWTQWIFLQLFKYGLAYKAETPVGWCPACKIILANEEIVAGKCERCGHEAERRNQSQWLLRITAYADRLADELDLVDYPEYVKTAQRNWIGRTQGIEIDYPVVNEAGQPHSQVKKISCYSTRPDTNFGATFIVIAPEHLLVAKLTTAENKEKVSKYVERAKKKSELERTELEKEKTGVFTGSYALNRLSGKKMPIYVSDFVVLTAGTGIVVGVPAHDKRDFDFAKKYGLEIIPVIKPKKGAWDFSKGPFLDIDDALVFNSDFLNGLKAKEAIKKIIDYLVKKKWGRRAANYHLRDWIFSRQHYWGEPIPMVYCQTCAEKGISWFDLPEAKEDKKIGNWQLEIGNSSQRLVGWFPLAEKDLPLELPKVEKYQPTDTGESPLANVEDWVKTKCPHCGGPARRETDTMPNWAGSSWYFLRYCDQDNNSSLADTKKLKYWLPVDIYLGGAEHTTLHLLYSRFWHKFLDDIGAVPGKEPYAARRQHGVILGEDGQRMSKSRGNIVNPENVIDKFGVDALRIYLMFMGPYEATMPWNTKGVEGAYRFLTRIWRLCQTKDKIAKAQKHSGSGVAPAAHSRSELRVELHRTIKKVSEDIENLKHNTAIAAMMEFLNAWSEKGAVLSKNDAGVFLRLLAPFAPYLAEELWQQLRCSPIKVDNNADEHGSAVWSIHSRSWPKYDPNLIREEKVTIIVQINGKVRGQVEVQSANLRLEQFDCLELTVEGLRSRECKAQSEIEPLVKKEPNVAKYLKGKEIKKTIFIPGRLINFVVG